MKDERDVRRRRMSDCENHPSMFGGSLHHVVVRASGRTVRDRTGHGSFEEASSVSEESVRVSSWRS